MALSAIRLEPADTVAVAIQDLPAGTAVEAEGLRVTTTTAVPRGHKVALKAVPKGENVIKYAVPIGRARADIAPGDHVHTHNLEDTTEELCARYAREFREKAGVQP